jgi:hypothetical protein
MDENLSTFAEIISTTLEYIVLVVSMIIGNLILVDDSVNRSHSISMLILFFIINIEDEIIRMDKIHIIILLYLAIGIDFSVDGLFVRAEVIVL